MKEFDYGGALEHLNILAPLIVPMINNVAFNLKAKSQCHQSTIRLKEKLE